MDVREDALRRAGLAIIMSDSAGNLADLLCGTVPLSWAPMQTARDGEDHAFPVLSRCCSGPAAVHSDCQGSVECAVSKLRALGKDHSRRHLWQR